MMTSSVPVHSVSRAPRAWPLLLALAALLFVGCGDDEDGAFAWEGAYTVTAWTENPTGCDAEGPSVLAEQTETRFVVKRNRQSLFGQVFFQIVAGPCADAQDCSNRASSVDPFGLGAALGGLTVFGDQKTGDVYETSLVSASQSVETQECTAVVTLSTLASPAEGQVRLERRTYTEVTYPAVMEDGEPRCLTEDNTSEIIRMARESGTCGQLSAIVADTPEALPPPEMSEGDGASSMP